MRGRALLIVIAFLSFAILFANAVEIFVSPQGRDASLCGATAGSACASIAFALASTQESPINIILLDGIHRINESIVAPNNRPTNITAGAPNVVLEASISLVTPTNSSGSTYLALFVLNYGLFQLNGPMEIRGRAPWLLSYKNTASVVQYPPQIVLSKLDISMQSFGFVAASQERSRTSASATADAFGSITISDVHVHDIVAPYMRDDSLGKLSFSWFEVISVRIYNSIFERILPETTSDLDLLRSRHNLFVMQSCAEVVLSGVTISRVLRISSISIYDSPLVTISNVAMKNCLMSATALNIEEGVQAIISRSSFTRLVLAPEAQFQVGDRLLILFMSPDRLMSETSLTISGVTMEENQMFGVLFAYAWRQLSLIDTLIDGMAPLYSGINTNRAGCVALRENENVLIKGSAFARCFSMGNGGCLISTSNRVLTISDSEFTYCQGQNGGALYHAFSQSTTFSNVLFANNHATIAGGAAVVAGGVSMLDPFTQQAQLTLDRTNFTSNTCATGSAMMIQDHVLRFGGGAVKQNTVLFDRNYGTSGTLVLHNVATLFSANAQVLFYTNALFQLGGGIFAQQSTFTFETTRTQQPRLDFISNRANDGAAIYFAGEVTAPVLVDMPFLKIISCIGNTATTSGGCFSFKLAAQKEHLAASVIPKWMEITHFQGNTAAYGDVASAYAASVELVSVSGAITPLAKLEYKVQPAPLTFSLNVVIKDLLNNTIVKNAQPFVVAYLQQPRFFEKKILYLGTSTQQYEGLSEQIANLDAATFAIGDTFQLLLLPQTQGTNENVRLTLKLTVDGCPAGYAAATDRRSCVYVFTAVLVVSIVCLIIVSACIVTASFGVLALVQIRKRRVQQRLVNKLLGGRYLQTLYDQEDGTQISNDDILEIVPPNFIIDKEELKIGDILGQGSQALVFSAAYREAPCAVKLYTRSSILQGHEETPSEFINELKLYCGPLSNHVNIVRFLGVCNYGAKVGLVFEQMRCSLDALISRYNALKEDPQTLAIPLSRKISLLKSIAAGTRHLHANGIIWRDLKHENCLVSDENETQAKITDFGWSARLRDNSTSTMGVGTCFALAPECISQDSTRGQYNERCDVYSFGVLMYCLLAEVVNPYPNMSDVTVLLGVKDGTLRPTLNDTVYYRMLERQCVLDGLSQARTNQVILRAHSLLDLMRRCWSQQPSDRPPLSEITKSLSSILVWQFFQGVSFGRLADWSVKKRRATCSLSCNSFGT